MYEYITGTLTEITPTDAIVEAYGVGYDLMISLTTFSKIQNACGSPVKLYTCHLVREDDESLYGFADKMERAVFLQLIAVSGVGPGSARMILSAMSPQEVREAVIANDVKKFKSVKGIGLKTAQRILVDMKDKVDQDSGEFSFQTTTGVSTVREEAVSALTLLGFPKASVEKVVSELLKENATLALEGVIRLALKML